MDQKIAETVKNINKTFVENIVKERNGQSWFQIFLPSEMNL